MRVWKDTSEIQPERFMMDPVKTREMMSTIERAYDLTTSQATILCVEGLNKEIRKEMGRLMLTPNNTIKHWSVIPEDEPPEVSTQRLR